MAYKTPVFFFLLLQVLFLLLEFTAMDKYTMSMYITLDMIFTVFSYSMFKLFYSRHHTATLDNPNENTPLLPIVLPPTINEPVTVISP